MCEGARLVTVVGAAGIGKTTVALAVAARMAETIEHDVRLVDLAPVTDLALVPSAIAAAIGLTVHSADERSALRMFLRDRRLMLVLDNCEHIIDAAAICVRDILAAAAGVRILATSREALRAEGEMVYRLPPLETPPDSHELMAAEALAFPAVELFVERATATLNAFSLDDATRRPSPRFAASSTAWRWPSNSLRHASTPSRSARSLPSSMTGSVCSRGGVMLRDAINPCPPRWTGAMTSCPRANA